MLTLSWTMKHPASYATSLFMYFSPTLKELFTLLGLTAGLTHKQQWTIWSRGFGRAWISTYSSVYDTYVELPFLSLTFFCAPSIKEPRYIGFQVSWQVKQGLAMLGDYERPPVSFKLIALKSSVFNSSSQGTLDICCLISHFQTCDLLPTWRNNPLLATASSPAFSIAEMDLFCKDADLWWLWNLEKSK